jgi:hypothetical protein
VNEHGWPDDADGPMPDPHHPDGPDLDQPDLVFPEVEYPEHELPELPELPAADLPDAVWETADLGAAEEPGESSADDGGDPYPSDDVDRGHDGLLGPVGADPDAVADAHPGADVFPPPVHVGELPEPVDGFPWIDTGSLGVVTAETPAATNDVDSADLAAYAETDLPPGVDPWAALAASDDPATAALAKFWAPETPPQ